MKNLLALLSFFLVIITNISSQNFQLPLWEKEIPNSKPSSEKEIIEKGEIIKISKVQEPSIEVYLPPKRDATGQAVIICPGGGYYILAHDIEGLEIAKWLNSKGIAGIVLKYRLPEENSNIIPHKSPLLDAKRAMRLVRSNAAKWNIETDQIGIMGFSAGGHLASSLGTHFDFGNKLANDPVEQFSSRPNFMALIYPAISLMNRKSVSKLLGKDNSEALKKYYSSELQVAYDTPPTFLLHTTDDTAAPVENSLLFYQALRAKEIPAEMHIYEEGGHGYGLAANIPNLQTWTDRFADWLEKQNKPNPDKENWQALFNGKDMTGWDMHFSGHELNDNYKNTVQVEDGILRIKYDEYETFDKKFGHIYYHQPFEYYKLRFAYRFLGKQTKGGASWNVRNSGVMIHSQSAQSLGLNQHFPVSIEIQLLGGLNKGERATANICTPGTLFEMDGKEIRDHCLRSKSKTYHGDQWVNVEALVYGDSLIVHIVEGDTVLTYEHPKIDHIYVSEKDYNWEDAFVKNPKDFEKRAGELLTGGYIALQAESHPIDFKNIEILNLKGCMDPKAKNYKSYYIKNDKNACRY